MNSIAQRLREIRTAKGLSLRDVQIASAGKIPAVVLGSYERADRALSVGRAIQIAEFYGLPLTYLLSEPASIKEYGESIVIDLRRLRLLAGDQSSISDEGIHVRTVTTYIAGIINKRNDWNGEVLTVRADDVEFLATALGGTRKSLIEILRRNKMLIQLDR